MYPAIDFTNAKLTSENGLAMIDLARQLGTHGFNFYRWDQRNIRTDLPESFADVPEPGAAMAIVLGGLEGRADE